MGREIRRVPPEWEHPRDWQGRYEAMRDRPFDPAMDEWIEGRRKWNSGEDPDRATHDMPYHQWAGGPPNPQYHRPDWPAESQTAYQVYETVSEGTPVSPVFTTEDELILWLVNDGSGMGIGGTRRTMSREAAEKFVAAAWAPSMVFTPSTGLQSGLSIHEENQ